MNKKSIISIIALVVVAFGALKATTVGSVVYFNRATISGPNLAFTYWEEGHSLCSLEYADLLGRIKKTEKLQDNCSISQEFIEINKQLKKLWQTAGEISMSIAKRRGACAVFNYENPHDGIDSKSSHYGTDFFYINPAYDITKEVIATLNKEHKAKKVLK